MQFILVALLLLPLLLFLLLFFRNGLVCIFAFAGLILWIFSLSRICNACHVWKDGFQVPCKPMHSTMCQ
jgi:hypothetical protein